LAKRKMNAALTLVLSLALITSALPVIAQEQTEAPRSFDLRAPAPTTGSLARAATREAVRLAAAGKARSFGNETVPQDGRSTSDWSRVRQLAPGAEIVLTVKSSWTAPRYFVAADSLELVVSNAAGQVEHIARADIIEIKKERSKVLFYSLAGPLSIALVMAGGAIGHAIQGGEGLGGPLLGALAVGVGGAVLVHKLYPKWNVIYRAP
jgi:hypothetical protein